MMNSDKIILDLCGGTGSWSKPFKDAGYDVRLITLPENDVRFYQPPENVYGILAAPPCTEFAVSGARWWKGKDPTLLPEALYVFDSCVRIVDQCRNLKFWALENPVGRLKYLRRSILGEPKLIFNPCDFGDPYTKKTLLWGNFNIPKYNKVEPTEGSKLHKIGPGKDRQMLRSITPQGFANAFFKANQ